MSRKTVNFNNQGIEKLPDDKPVVYKIQTGSGANNYTGIAQRGRVQARIAEHLSGSKDPIPGAKIQIEQMSSIADARAKESRIISRSKVFLTYLAAVADGSACAERSWDTTPMRPDNAWSEATRVIPV